MCHTSDYFLMRRAVNHYVPGCVLFPIVKFIYSEKAKLLSNFKKKWEIFFKSCGLHRVDELHLLMNQRVLLRIRNPELNTV